VIDHGIGAETNHALDSDAVLEVESIRSLAHRIWSRLSHHHLGDPIPIS